MCEHKNKPKLYYFFIKRYRFITTLKESELVSGFMTEHAAVIFVFFFLAEYASIVLICILASILFLGGYLLDISFFIDIIQYIINITQNLLHISNNILDISYNMLFQYEFNISNLNSLSKYDYQIDKLYIYSILSNPFITGIFYSLSLAVKTCVMIFVFI